MTSDDRIESPPLASDQGQDAWKIARLATKFAILFAMVWLALFATSRRLPYIRPGADILYNAKEAVIGRGNLFPKSAPVRVAAFGNSRTLAGFIPQDFDRAVGRGCVSFNFGLPDATHFVNELERLIASGDVPTHVLLQIPWSKDDETTLGTLLDQDRKVINLAFPFRVLPRDALVFWFMSRRNGGLRAFYQKSAEVAAQVIQGRGYYFIKGQSHYPGDRLPDNFSLPTDRPELVKRREVSVETSPFRRLEKLVRAHDIQVILIPDHFRRGVYAAPPAINETLVHLLKPFERFHVLGPDYDLFENRDFSDPVHLNPEGARRYTARLAQLFRDMMD